MKQIRKIFLGSIVCEKNFPFLKDELLNPRQEKKRTTKVKKKSVKNVEDFLNNNFKQFTFLKSRTPKKKGYVDCQTKIHC